MVRRLLANEVDRSRALRAATALLCAVGAAVFVTLAPSVAQTGTIGVYIDPATQTVPVSETFTSTIEADCTDIGLDGLGAYEFELVYDPSYLQVASIADAGELNVNGRTTQELGVMEVAPGRTAFGAYSYYSGTVQTAGPTGTVALATVVMTATQAGTAALDLDNVLLVDTQGVGWPGDGRSVNPISGTVTIEEAGILGDVNGDGAVNSTDALIILSCDANLDTSQFCPMDCGDVNYDALVNSTDALIVLSYDANISVPYPVGDPGCPSGVTPCPGCSP